VAEQFYAAMSDIHVSVGATEFKQQQAFHTTGFGAIFAPALPPQTANSGIHPLAIQVRPSPTSS
jgi:hypothetical protein